MGPDAVTTYPYQCSRKTQLLKWTSSDWSCRTATTDTVTSTAQHSTAQTSSGQHHRPRFGGYLAIWLFGSLTFCLFGNLFSNAIIDNRVRPSPVESNEYRESDDPKAIGTVIVVELTDIDCESNRDIQTSASAAPWRSGRRLLYGNLLLANQSTSTPFESCRVSNMRQAL